MLFTSHPQNDHQYILRRRPSPRLETRHAYHGGLLFDGHRGTLTCSICDSTYFRRVGGCGNRDCVMSRFAPNLHPPNMCYYLVHRGSQPPNHLCVSSSHNVSTQSIIRVDYENQPCGSIKREFVGSEAESRKSCGGNRVAEIGGNRGRK